MLEVMRWDDTSAAYDRENYNFDRPMLNLLKSAEYRPCLEDAEGQILHLRYRSKTHTIGEALLHHEPRLHAFTPNVSQDHGTSLGFQCLDSTAIECGRNAPTRYVETQEAG